MFNVEGLKTNSSSTVPFLKDMLDNKSMYLLSLSETWLREHLDPEVNIDGYAIYRCDRDRLKKRRGRNSGGVAVYLRNDFNIQTEVLLQYSSGVIEALGLRIPKLNLVIITVYRQPNDIAGGNISTSVQFQLFLNEVEGLLQLLQTPLPTIVITGDFNLPNVDWSSCSMMAKSSSDEKRMMSMLQDLISNNFLSQIVDKPTHKGGNTLDLFLTNNADVFPCVEVEPSAFSSHHMVIFQSLLNYSSLVDCLPSSDMNNGFDNFNFFSEKTNWDQINHELSTIDWTERLSGEDLSESFDAFTQTCLEVCCKYTPTKRLRSQIKNKVPRDRIIII